MKANCKNWGSSKDIVWLVFSFLVLNLENIGQLFDTAEILCLDRFHMNELVLY